MALNRSQKIFYGGIAGVVFFMLLVFVIFGKPPPPPTRDVTLTIWGVLDNQSDIQPILNDFLTYYKTLPEYQYTNLTIEYRKWGVDEIEDLVINQLAEGEGPDIFYMNNTWLAKHFRKLVPTPANIMGKEEFQSTFVPVATTDLIKNDQIYAMPLYIDTLALYYNVAHYQDADITNSQPSRTWEGIKDDVEKLVVRGSTATGVQRAGIALGTSNNILNAVDIMYMLMLQYGAAMCDPECTHATFNQEPKTVEGTASELGKNPTADALQLFTAFSSSQFPYYTWHADFLQSPRDTGTTDVDAFVNDQVSAIIGYSDLYAQIKSRTERRNFLFDVAEIPQLQDPVTTNVRDAYANYWAPAVSRTSDDPVLAWQLIKFMTSREALLKYHTATKRPPSREDLLALYQAEDGYKAFARQSKYAKSLAIFDEQQFNPILKDMVDDVTERNLSVRDAVDRAVQRVNAILENEIQVRKQLIEPGIPITNEEGAL